jgi:hypothetical protein
MKATSTCIRASALAVCLAGTLISCQTATPDVTNARDSGHWKQIRSTPPTFFPRETPIDHPVGFEDGYWVHSGDEKGTRFFIPIRHTDIPSDQLIAEAQACMTPEAKKSLLRRQRDFDAKNAAGNIAGQAGKGFLWLISGLGSGSWGSGSFDLGSLDIGCMDIGGMDCSGM